MRISTLRLAGFGPFLSEQVVEFERFADDGIFLLTGKTGAGKSSILDAICFALFASVPRYDGTQQKLRSDFCAPTDPTWVELEFTVGEHDYRVRRSPEYERPKVRGGGVTRSPATAEMFVREGDSWRGLAARPVDVAPRIASIVGLNKEQFLQVILLAQNRFNRFLRAGNDDRQAVLRTLFATERFSTIEESFAERRRSLEASVAGSADRLTRLSRQVAEARNEAEPPQTVTAEWLEEALAGALEELSANENSAIELDAAHAVAEAEARLAAARHSDQARRRAAIERREGLLAAAASVERDRERVARAREAAILWPSLTAAEQARQAALDALRVHEHAHAQLTDIDGALDDTDAAVSVIDGELAMLSEAEELERSFPSLQAAVDESTTRLSEVEAQLTASTSDTDSIPALIDEMQRSLTLASADAAREPEAHAALERLTALLAHARHATKLESDRTEAQLAETQASRAHLDAVAAHHSLMEQRLTGRAAELATLLVDGDPCAVCGSTEHPSPARNDAPSVSQRDVDHALARAEELRLDRDAATQHRQALDVALAEANTATEGQSVAQLQSAVDDANHKWAAAREAAGRVSALNTELGGLRDRQSQLLAEIDALRTSKEQLVPHVATATANLESATARVTAALGGFGSIEERVASLKEQRSRVVAYRAATTDREARERSSSEAQSTLDRQIALSPFAREIEVREARLPDSEITAIERSIVDHDQALATADHTIEELALVPTEDPDVEGAESRARASRSALDEALAQQGALRQRAEAVAAVVAEAQRELAASESLVQHVTLVRELAGAVAGKEPNTMRMRLETYVLAAQLEEIVTAANARLRAMTSGRFSLQHDDSVQYRNAASGLGLAILDEHSGRVRATQSLSGGETFLASLALALGLAEVVTNQAGGITLDTLFIDEGFGSLDTETLEIAMSTLDGLRAGGRTIGLISHVESMKEQIPAKLRVSTDVRGHSRIETEVS